MSLASARSRMLPGWPVPLVGMLAGSTSIFLSMPSKVIVYFCLGPSIFWPLMYGFVPPIESFVSTIFRARLSLFYVGQIGVRVLVFLVGPAVHALDERPALFVELGEKGVAAAHVEVDLGE